MGEKRNSLLSIYTLGNFKVKKGNEDLNQVKKRSSKRWQLLGYLITYRERNVSREELIVNLNLNENTDPQGALSALVYRLRKRLGTDQNNSEYINTSGSAYTFNLGVNYWLDIEELEELLYLSKEKATEEVSKIFNLFNQALDLYKGDYLEEFNSQEWIWTFRNKYRESMIKTLLAIDEEFRKKNESYKLLKLYNKLQQKIPSDERLLKNSIEILINSGNLNQAKQKYNELVSLYEDNDLIVPVSIKKLERNLENAELKATDKIIFEDFEEAPNGAYLCQDRSVFRDIYKLEKRRMERDGRPRCITHIRLNSNLEKKKLEKYSKQLLEILRSQLRAGDLICHWRLKHFNILLMDIGKNEVEKVIRRIKRYFNSKYNPENKLELIFKNYQLKSD